GRSSGFLQPVDRADVGVVERGQDLRLALEPRQSVRIENEISRKKFDRDVPIQLRIAGAINFAHSAFAHFREYLVWADRLTHDHGELHWLRRDVAIARG